MSFWPSDRQLDPTSTRDEEWPLFPGDRGRAYGTPTIRVAIHPRASNRVTFMLPGFDGAVDGYMDKYVKLADLTRELGSAVVRTSNQVVPGQDFGVSSAARVNSMVSGALEGARRICGDRDPELQLFGFSAGASAMAAALPALSRVTKVLLVAPSSDAGYDEVVAGLREFRGELYVLVGAQDEVVEDLPLHLFEEAVNAGKKELRVLPGCDHQFRGVMNGRILSQAPRWAFTDWTGFPDARGGRELY